MSPRRAAHWPHTVTLAPSRRVSRSSASGTACGRSTSSARPGTAMKVASPVSQRLTSTPAARAVAATVNPWLSRSRASVPQVTLTTREVAGESIDCSVWSSPSTPPSTQTLAPARLAGRPLGGGRARRLPDDRVAAVRPGDRLQRTTAGRSWSGARGPGCSTTTATRCARSRPRSASGAPVPAGPDGTNVELLLSHPTGFVEMYAGVAEPAKVELRTDGVMRSPDGQGVHRRPPDVRQRQQQPALGHGHGRDGRAARSRTCRRSSSASSDPVRAARCTAPAPLGAGAQGVTKTST